MLGATPLDVSRDTEEIVWGGESSFFSSLKKGKFLLLWEYFSNLISLGRVNIPSPKIVINLPLAYEKLNCKR